jgi:hypothetical protein
LKEIKIKRTRFLTETSIFSRVTSIRSLIDLVISTSNNSQLASESERANKVLKECTSICSAVNNNFNNVGKADLKDSGNFEYKEFRNLEIKISWKENENKGREEKPDDKNRDSKRKQEKKVVVEVKNEAQEKRKRKNTLQKH